MSNIGSLILPTDGWILNFTKKYSKTNHCNNRVLSHKVKAWDSTCYVRFVGDDTRANGSWPEEIDSLRFKTITTKLPENIVSICHIRDMLILSPRCTKLFFLHSEKTTWREIQIDKTSCAICGFWKDHDTLAIATEFWTSQTTLWGLTSKVSNPTDMTHLDLGSLYFTNSKRYQSQ